MVGAFIVINANVYLDDVLTRKSRTLTNIEDEIICEEELDRENMQPLYESTLKFLDVFETGPDANYCKFHYNQDGSFRYCEYNYMDEYDSDKFEIDRLPWVKDRFQLSDAEYNYYLTAELYPHGLV